MGSFKRASSATAAPEVDAAISAGTADRARCERDVAEHRSRTRRASEGRDRERSCSRALGHGDRARARDPRPQRAAREANERHDRSIASLDAVTARLRGDPGAGARPGDPDPDEGAARGGRGQPAGAGADRGGAGTEAAAEPHGAEATDGHDEFDEALFEGRSSSRSARSATSPSWSGSRTRSASSAPPRSRSSASPRAARPSRCSLDEPVDLLRELEERSPLDFKVRRTADDNLILDVDEDQGPEQRAA